MTMRRLFASDILVLRMQVLGAKICMKIDHAYQLERATNFLQQGLRLWCQALILAFKLISCCRYSIMSKSDIKLDEVNNKIWIIYCVIIDTIVQVPLSPMHSHGYLFSILSWSVLVPGLHKLSVLNMEGCPGSTACLDSLAVAAIPALLYSNLSRCNLSDDECEKFSGLQNLKALNLGFNDISDACLVHTRGLMNLESLNLDSCRIDDEGLVNLTASNIEFFVQDLVIQRNGMEHEGNHI
ncbi:hypothetical protein ACSBR2_013351 [Camellia fascicularis]